MEKTKKKVKRVIHAVSFDESTYKALKEAAEQEGVEFGVYVKAAALNYTKATIEHDQLLSAINPGDQNEGQKTFNKTITELREVLNHTLVNTAETTEKRLDRIEKLIRLSIYAQIYYTRELPPEARDLAQKSAKTRTEQLLKVIDSEPRA